MMSDTPTTDGQTWQDLAKKRLAEVRKDQTTKRTLRDKLAEQARGLTKELHALDAEAARLERALRPPTVRTKQQANETAQQQHGATSAQGEAAGE